jgi:hypothetical protein
VIGNRAAPAQVRAMEAGASHRARGEEVRHRKTRQGDVVPMINDGASKQ